MPKGESRRLTFTPGEKRPRSAPPDEGRYTAKMDSIGKAGPKGWISKTGKFPCRHTRIAVQGTEDEVTGKEKTVMFFASASPKAWGIFYDFALAVGYPNTLEIPEARKPTSPEVSEVCEAMDMVFNWCLENDVEFQVDIAHEEYQGQPTARVKFLPPEETEDSSSEEVSEEEVAEEDAKEAEESTEEAETEASDDEEELEEAEDGEDIDHSPKAVSGRQKGASKEAKVTPLKAAAGVKGRRR